MTPSMQACAHAHLRRTHYFAPIIRAADTRMHTLMRACLQASTIDPILRTTRRQTPMAIAVGPAQLLQPKLQHHSTPPPPLRPGLPHTAPPPPTVRAQAGNQGSMPAQLSAAAAAAAAAAAPPSPSPLAYSTTHECNACHQVWNCIIC